MNGMSSVSPKGQVTIPAEIREQFDIRTRDRVQFRIVEGVITLIPLVSGIDDLYGSLAEPKNVSDWEKAEQTAKDEYAERLVAEDSADFDAS